MNLSDPGISFNMHSEGYSTQFVGVCVCVCVCVTSPIATSLTYRHKVRYESQANAVLKVFDSWISLEIFCSNVMALFAYRDDPWHFL